MKSIRAFHWAFAFLTGFILTGCGGNSAERTSITGPVPAGKLAATPEQKVRAGVSVLVWNYADGRPAAGAEVTFSRSISRRVLNYQWTATADADGIAQLDLVAPPETPAGRRGASGYYSAKATDPVTGEVLGTWNSLPINGGKEHVISLPLGGPVTISSGSGPLAVTGIGRFNWTGPIAGLPGTLVSAAPTVLQRNTEGEAWGLFVGYLALKDVNPGTGEEVPGLEITIPFVAKYLCWDLTGEGDSFQFKWEIDKSPALLSIVGTQSVGRILDPGDGVQARVAYVGAASPAIAEFGDLGCGDDFSPPIQAAVDAGTAIEYNFGGTFRIIHHSN